MQYKLSSAMLQATLLLLVLPLCLSQWVDPPPRYVCPDRPLYPCNCTRGSEEGLYVECTNTNLASLAVGLKQVRTLIHTLEISNCNIERLYGNAFRPLSVKHLIIKDTPVKDISDGTFDAHLGETVEELHITNSWLTRFPPTIKNFTNLKVRTCIP